MPINLNALLRYKTIDDCLSNPNAPSTIQYLIAKCSDALYDANGNRNGVSERTIRNDIRILRSDLLGFNAPIEVENGMYFYTDLDFTLFKRSFEGLDILISIQDLLIEEFDNIQNDKVSLLLEKLSLLTKKELPQKYRPEKPDSSSHILEKKIGFSYESSLRNFMITKESKKYFWSKKNYTNYYNWECIFKVI